MSQINQTLQKHPLQNRVDPFGQLIRTKARGSWLGNRGLIHDENQEIVRPFRLKAWITCLLEFKNRHRAVMTPGLYTELFFLDEATAFSAGHRPCAECRRADFNRFKEAWLRGNTLYMYNMKTPIGKIDEIIQNERITSKGEKGMFRDKMENLPEGCFIEFQGIPYIIKHPNRVIRWTPFGYSDSIDLSQQTKVNVLTPKSIVNSFRSGYIPLQSESAR
jgi:hypothetical protein